VCVSGGEKSRACASFKSFLRVGVIRKLYSTRGSGWQRELTSASRQKLEKSLLGKHVERGGCLNSFYPHLLPSVLTQTLARYARKGQRDSRALTAAMWGANALARQCFRQPPCRTCASSTSADLNERSSFKFDAETRFPPNLSSEFVF